MEGFMGLSCLLLFMLKITLGKHITKRASSTNFNIFITNLKLSLLPKTVISSYIIFMAILIFFSKSSAPFYIDWYVLLVGQ